MNARPETVNLLEENIQAELLDLGFGNDFLDLTPNTKATKAKIGSETDTDYRTKKLLLTRLFK